MTSWRDVIEWRQDRLKVQLEPLRARRKQLIEAYEKLQSMEMTVTSRGLTADAILYALHQFEARISYLINDVSETMMAMAQMADGVWTVQTLILECKQKAKTHGLEIRDGRLISNSGQREDEFASAAAELKPMIKGALDKADAIDEAYYTRLTTVADGSYKSSEGGFSTSPGLPDLPQKGWTMGESAAWWSGLTDSEKENMVREHPELIGNRDGVPMEWRDKANRARLPQEIAEMKSNVAKAKSRMDEAESTGSKNDLGYLNAVNDYNRYKKKLGDLEGLQSVLKENESKVPSSSSPDRQRLIYLDSKSSSRVQAGVALGDVDRAKAVQMVVPGMNNTVGDNMDGLIGDAQNVRDSTLREANKHASSAGIQGKNDVATVAWMYRTPQNAEVATTDLAEKAAPKMDGFMEGVQTSRQTMGVPKAEIDVGAHSYGSTMAGIAVGKVREGTVHNIALYGSPGSGVQDVREYNIDGHAYVSGVNTNDYVQGIGPDGPFGKDPMEMRGFKHLANNPENDSQCKYIPTGAGSGVTKFCSKGDDNPFGRHSEYLKTGTGSLKDISRVMGGMEPEGEK
jgi:hypothetical protein